MKRIKFANKREEDGLMGMSSVSPDLRELRRFGSYVRNRFGTFRDTVSLDEQTWRKKRGKRAAFFSSNFLYFEKLFFDEVDFGTPLLEQLEDFRSNEEANCQITKWRKLDVCDNHKLNTRGPLLWVHISNCFRH